MGDRVFLGLEVGVRVAVELVLACLLGCGFLMLGLGGGAWILGGIAAGAIALFSLNAIAHRFNISWLAFPLPPNKALRKAGQILIGLTIGSSIHLPMLVSVSTQIPWFVAIVLLLLLGSLAIGRLYAWLEVTDWLTGTLATTPGNIGVMASIAADFSKNSAQVSLVQLLRFTTIIVVVPLLAHITHSTDVGFILHNLVQDPRLGQLQAWGVWVVVLVGAIAAVQLGSRIGIPVAAFFCPVLVGIAATQWLGDGSGHGAYATLPPLLNLVGQVLLGITIGEYWALNPRLKLTTLMHAVVCVGLMLSLGLATATLLHVLTSWSWLTCLLVAAPGGSPEMIWIALSLDQTIEIVTAAHLVRLLVLNLSLPGLIGFIGWWDTKRTRLRQVSSNG